MPSSIRSVAVFCGSSSGSSPVYEQTAFALGEYLAAQDIQLIYGGAQVGLMGAVADGALSKEGSVIGVIPDFLCTKEIAHTGLTELIIVESMHERKLRMHALSDAIIALPGGWGTMEELMEMLTWAQLGLHTKPIGLLNINGYYDGLLTLIRSMEGEGFLKREHAAMLLVSDSIADLMEQLNAYEPLPLPKWITEART